MYSSKDLIEKDQQYVMQTYGRFPIVIDHGQGATLWSPEGERYIDFTSGIGVNSLGYGNQKWIEAIESQIQKLGHISNLFYSEPYILLAEKLVQLSGMKKVFFSNSGAESNEGAIKLARKYSYDRYGEGRAVIITLINSFHGRTITTLKATGQKRFHQYFYPFTEGFRYAEAGNIDSLLEALGENNDVCAVMLEGIQGEGGVFPLEQSYLNEVQKICNERDLLLIADEVQTGIGRTGKMFAYQTLNYQPDVVTFAKGIAGGLPMGGILAGEKAADVLSAGTHATTFGGNPICASAALAVLDEVEKLLPEINAKGNQLKTRIQQIDSDEIKEVRGTGLMIGVELKTIQPGTLVKKLIENGVLALTAGTNVLRLLPPLVISSEEIEEGIGILETVLKEMQS